MRKALAVVGYALLALALLGWALFVVFVVQPWYIREVGTW